MAAISNYPASHPPPSQSNQSPPSKASLKAWWKQFTFVQKFKAPTQSTPQSHSALVKEWGQRKASATGQVFGVPLRDSLRYASVHISTANNRGEMYVWGYIPVVVAKCGLYLKEYATEVQGTFRVSGSAKRMRDLQILFETPPKYGKNVDWSAESYTPHDVASVFRRYLTQMPEPVIPFDMYEDFRQVLARQPPIREDEAIGAYKRLILQLPRANQYLLLYVLDLLSVFSRKADKNLMTATNLATIFRPGILSHPSHEMSPEAHRLSQTVLEFLIAQQDWFMLDVPPPGRRDSILGAAPTDVTINVLDEKSHPFAVDRSLDQPGADWKLVENGGGKGVGRRHTITDRSSTIRTGKVLLSERQPPTDSMFVTSRQGDMAIAPIATGEDIILADGTSVQRSVTIPARRSQLMASEMPDGTSPTKLPTRKRFSKVTNALHAAHDLSKPRSKSPPPMSSTSPRPLPNRPLSAVTPEKGHLY